MALIAGKKLYHVCHGIYKAGDIKPKGTYWAGLLAAGHNALNDPDGEFIRESVRAADFPNKPSRIRSSFVFESLTDAEIFLLQYRSDSTIYLVQFADNSAIPHKVTWSAFQTSSPIPLHVQARDFWSGDMLYSSNIEIFAESDLIFQ